MTEKQYRKLIESYKPGGFARENKIVTVFDNDGGYFSCHQDIDDDQAEEVVADFVKKMGFDGPDGYSDLVELAKAAGLTAEWC